MTTTTVENALVENGSPEPAAPVAAPAALTPFARALAAIPLFASLEGQHLTVLATRLRRRAYAERAVIVRRDTPGDALFILLTGKVKVSYPAADPDDAETIIALMRAGDFFGELSVLDGEGRSADVIALEPTECLVLSATDFHECLRQMPEISLALLKQLAGRLRRSTKWIHSLASQDVYGRIAQQLLYLSDAHGKKLPDGAIRIGVRLTQGDLAGIVGASRESVNKAMGFYKSKGYISVDTSHYITVHNPSALEIRTQ